MGFFDLFCVALAGGIALSSTAKERQWDEENRSKAIKRGYRTYMDHRGSRRLISNNRLLRETNEPFKFELCDINDHGLGQYIIDNGLKKYIEDERRADQEKEENRLRAVYKSDTENLFEEACKRSMISVKREYEEAHKPWSNPEYAKYARYWMVPFHPYGAFKEKAGRASWNLHLAIEYYISHGFHIYDAEDQKYVMLFRNFNREKAESLEPLRVTLKNVIDDLEDGKSYLIDLTDEIVTFEIGKYNIDAIAICKKGSQVELPPDHVLIQGGNQACRNFYRDYMPISRMDFMTAVRESNDWEREQVAKAIEWEDYYSKKGQQYGTWHYQGFSVNNLL